MRRTRAKILFAVLAALLLAAGCKSGDDDDEDELPAVQYKVLGGRLVWCSGGADELAVPGNASSIGNNAFNNCGHIKTLTIPASVTYIMSGTFSRVEIDTIYFGGTYDDWDAMVDGFGFTLGSTPVKCADDRIWIWTAPAVPDVPDVPVNPDDCEITEDGVFARYTGSAPNVRIPDGVTAIGAGAFEGCADITHVTIPGGVTSIGENAFKDCAGLTDIEIPDGVAAIGENAFAGCDSLASVDIPASVEAIGAGAIPAETTVIFCGTAERWDELAANAGLDGLTVFIIDENGTLTGYRGSESDIVIPDSVTAIGDGAFSGCAGLTGVTIPASVEHIGSGAFSGCAALTDVTIPASVEHIGDGAFSGCAGLTGVTIPAGVTDIGAGAFKDCAALTDVTIPGGVTNIGDGAFSGCAGLTDVTIPAGVTDIGAGAFKDCAALTDIAIPASVEHIGDGAFDGCTSLEDITYGGTMEQLKELTEGSGIDLSAVNVDISSWVIRDGVLVGYCGSETDIKIPGGVTAIGDGAFSGCTELTNIAIPASVTTIGADALACGNLETITFAGTVADWRERSRGSGVGNDVTVICSDGMWPPTVYVASTGSDDNPGSRAKPFATIQKAVDTVIAMNDGTSAYTIYVDGTLTQSAAASTDGMADFSALAKNLTLTIKALSGTATLDANQKSRVINALPASGKLNLTLENLTVTGGNTTGNGGGMYFGSAGGTLTISDGTTIKGNTASVNGGGLYVNAGTFTMTGGTISDCTATTQGGGVCIKSGGTFEMSGTAKITGCKMTSTAGGTGGGGIYNSGTLTIIGGTISGNTASSYGGGICVYDNGTFTMTGGTISGNTASASGGGVYVSGGLSTSGTFAMTGDTTISGNTAGNDGGGVCVYNGTFTMDGGTISKNKANGSSEVFGGGGIYLYRATTSMPGGRFTLKGGTVSENEADYGGGIWAGGSSEYAMEGGSVSENKATYGGGAYSCLGCTFKMSGAAQFAADNDVYLKQSETIPTIITVAGALTAASPVATITPSAYTAGTQVLSGAATTLAANCGKFEVSEAGWKIDGEGKLAVAPDIYVSEDGDNTNGKGSQAKPFAKLQKAFDLIQTLNLSTVSYTVHISGAVKGKSELSADVSAQKISITGTTGAKLDGNRCSSWLLTISCSAPVEITNVTLTNSWNGGLYVKSGADVTLGEGAAISKNSNILSGGRGGGVRNEGKFTMKSNAKISENDMTGDRDPGGGVYSNGTFIMEGGEISGNYTSTNYSTGYGGGVCIADGTFEMSGGTISGNRASSASRGGGVYVGSGTFTMTGGTISGNTASEGNGVCAYKSFNMSGAAKIAEDNDVYLANHSVIRIADNFSAQSPVATITHYTYAKESVLSLASGGLMSQDICDKFAVTPQDDGTKWKIVPSGSNGVLEKDNVSTGGGGISVTIPGQGTYTFKVVSGGTEIVDGSTLPQGATITLSEVRKDGVALTASDGTFLIELTDGVYSFESKGFSGTSATGLPSTISLPPLPPAPIPLLVYIKAEFANSIVIEKDIEVLVMP